MLLRSPSLLILTKAQGFTDSSGRRQYPSSALVLNFLQSAKEKPSLLTHDDLRKLFHELGHGMHNLLSKTNFARFHGTNVDSDFVEVPARMFENFVWNPTILSLMSCHYSYLSPEYLQTWQKEQTTRDTLPKQPPRRLPMNVAKRLKEVKYVNGAIYKMLQLHHSKFDIAAHSQIERDCSVEELAGLYDGMRHDLSGLAGISEIDGKPSNAFSAFRSIVALNYDAGYYTYIL
jgi:metallopeptidase MepB